MKEEYKEIYRFTSEHMEKIISRDMAMPRPFFKIESTYFLAGGEKLTEIEYVGYEDVRAMAKEVAEYENKAN
jgi:hypothetical protein